MRFLRFLLGFGLSFGAARAAAGQDRPPADSAHRLPEITVSSVRQTVSRFAAPLAVTRVDRGAAFGTKGHSLDEVIGRIPGVFAQSRSGGTDIRLSIRGFGARGAGDRSNAGTTRGVRVLIDGIPETEPDGRTSLDGVDLGAAESIEVIRSNASSLWGNAAGGVVSLATVGSGRVTEGEVTFGGFGFRRYGVRAGGGLGEGTITGVFTRSVFDGWRANSDGGRWFGNAGYRGAVGKTTELGVFAYATENRFAIPGPLTAAQVAQDPAQANPTYLQRFERRHNRVGRLGATIEHRLGRAGSVGGMLYVSPKFLQRSERGTFRDFTRYHVGGNLVYRAEAALAGGRRVRLLAGADEAYQDGAILFYSLTADGNRGTTLRDNKREGANNLGFFAQTDLELSSRWSASIGARYDRITYYAQSFINPKLDADKAFARVTPKIGLNFRLGSTQSVYANVGGGVEAPAGNETDPASTFGQDTVTALNPLLDPIRSTTFELGTKQLVQYGGGASWLSYDLALFQTNVRNEIVPYRGGRFYFTAGKVRRRGAEVAVSLSDRSGFGFDGALTWSDFQYTAYSVDSVHYGKAGAVADYAGNRVVGSPTWLYNGSVSYRFAGARRFRLQAGVQGNSRYFADDANLVSVTGYSIVSVSAGWAEPVVIGGVALRGSVAVNNLTNRKYIASSFLNPDVVNNVPVAFEPGLPRSLIVSLALGRR